MEQQQQMQDSSKVGRFARHVSQCVYDLPQQNELEEAPQLCHVDLGSHVVDVRPQQTTQVAFPKFEDYNEEQAVEPR